MTGPIRICNFWIPVAKSPRRMKKADKIADLLGDLSAAATPGTDGLDPCYTGYFTCFNDQRYYEAHDVLEHLWLQTRDANYAYYKGLIQLAGAFVHLQKQFLRPGHPKDSVRARPAVRLLLLAAKNLEPYRPHHLRLDVEGVWTLCTSLAAQIPLSNYANPWSPDSAPTLTLEPA
jgi:hypothetical protein